MNTALNAEAQPRFASPVASFSASSAMFSSSTNDMLVDEGVEVQKDTLVTILQNS